MTTTTPTTAPASGGTSTAIPPSPGTVTAAWVMESAWNTGYVANLVLTANSPVSGWSVSWSDPGAQSVTNAWGMRCSVGAGRI